MKIAVLLLLFLVFAFFLEYLIFDCLKSAVKIVRLQLFILGFQCSWAIKGLGFSNTCYSVKLCK